MKNSTRVRKYRTSSSFVVLGFAHPSPGAQYLLVLIMFGYLLCLVLLEHVAVESTEEQFGTFAMNIRLKDSSRTSEKCNWQGIRD